MNPKISIIAAIGKNRELGKDNKLLWHLPEDLKRFKELTKGHPMIMGRKTFESIGRVLPQRISIVVTRDTYSFLQRAKTEGHDVRGLIAVSALDEAIDLAGNKKIVTAGYEGGDIDVSEIFIIGGGQIFEQSMGLADKLYLTIVDGEFEADTFFPQYDTFSHIVRKVESSYDGLDYTFLELERGN